MTRPHKENRHGVYRGDGRSSARPQAQGNSTRRTWGGPRIPTDWRERQPAPADYYARRVAKLTNPNAGGWAQGKCPFHDDKAASLSVQVAPGSRGGWKCFAGCGSGDLLAFHIRLTGLPFKPAVADLIGVRA